MKTPEATKEKHINERKKKRDKLRRTIADEKLHSILFLALGTRGKTVFTLKTPRLKILSISLTELWTYWTKLLTNPHISHLRSTRFYIENKTTEHILNTSGER